MVDAHAGSPSRQSHCVYGVCVYRVYGGLRVFDNVDFSADVLDPWQGFSAYGAVRSMFPGYGAAFIADRALEDLVFHSI